MGSTQTGPAVAGPDESRFSTLLIGPAMIGLLQRIAIQETTVLLCGEPGTGKRLAARFLGACGPRGQQAWVEIDCDSLRQVMAGSSRVGEFPGKSLLSVRQQLLEPLIQADGGTILFDHMDALPTALQPILLRFLELGELQMPGSPVPLKIHGRVIATTRQNLAEMVEIGVFRKDLFYRLNVLSLQLPPLRQRQAEILPLLEYFMGRFAAKHRLAPCSIGSARSFLLRYSWPENLHELRQLAERMAVLRAGFSIEAEHLPEDVRTPILSSAYQYELPEEGLHLLELESDLIRQALEITNGHRGRSAQLLGISRHSLTYRMEKFGLDQEFQTRRGRQRAGADIAARQHG